MRSELPRQSKEKSDAMMPRRRVLKALSLAPFIGCGIASAEQKDLSSGEYFRLSWRVLDNPETSLAIHGALTPWISPDGRDRLTESTLRIIDHSNNKPAELFNCTETGFLEFAMPVPGVALLVTVWGGATAYLIKILHFHEQKVRVVLEERSHTFEWTYASGHRGLEPRIFVSDAQGFPAGIRRWKARVFVWEDDKFTLKKQCRFADRLSR
jgi:hypothetical protein